MKKNGMTKTECPNCGKELYTYMVNQSGHIRTVFCGKQCETEYKNPTLVKRYGRKPNR